MQFRLWPFPSCHECRTDASPRHEKLVEKYQVDMQYANERSCEQVVPDTHQLIKPRPLSRSASGFISNTSSRAKIDPGSLQLDLPSTYPSSSSPGLGLEPAPVVSNWEKLTSKLMNTTDVEKSDSEDEEVASYVKDILQLAC